jgi:hypothetical protein
LNSCPQRTLMEIGALFPATGSLARFLNTRSFPQTGEHK